MQCYTELLPPSAVTHAVSLPFLGPHDETLAVVKTSLLQLFHVENSQLVLLAEYPLAGTVTSIAPIHVPDTRCGGDALLIAFKDAKLSLLEWDAESHGVVTISIHYYEGDNVTEQPFGPGLGESESILTVDPSSRCAALNFGARSLAVLPFRQAGDDLMGDGDDNFDPDLDVAPPSASLKRTTSGINEAVNGEDTKQTPYTSSFVLPLTALDPALTHVVHLAFLHAYREPTFGILSAPIQTSTSLLEERKDLLSYTVFTLDLEQRASTNLITVQRLPSDLWKVLPLPLPVGGALLIGTNELVHVDQSGKTSAVAVNEFAKVSSQFGMANQSNLNMKLENCELVPLDSSSGDLLIVLSDGSLATLTFRLLGRKVGGLSIAKIAPESTESAAETSPSCAIALRNSKLFIGSQDGNSSILNWSKSSASLSRKRSHAQMVAADASSEGDEEAEDMDDDDLYATAGQTTEQARSTPTPKHMDLASIYNIEKIDSLPSLGPINSICFGRCSSMPEGNLELVGATGRGKGSRLAFIRRQLVPEMSGSASFNDARNIWSLNVRREDGEIEDDFDNLLCVYDGESTKVYDITASMDDQHASSVYSERTGTDFESDGETLFVSPISNGTSIVHCRRHEIRRYDASDISLAQIIPMIDDETDAELKIVHASFCDPYLLVLRDDSTVLVLQADESGEMEPLEVPNAIGQQKWLSGCLYRGGIFDESTVVFLFGEESGLHMFSLPNCDETCAIPTLPNLPTILSPEIAARRMGARETLTEILVADIGAGEFRRPYLIVRSALDDLTLYEPWRLNSESWTSSLRFRKVPFNYLPTFDETLAEESGGKPIPLRSISVGGRSIVYVHGGEPTFLLKDPCSHPKALSLQTKGVRALAPLHSPSCPRGFALVDTDGRLKECQLPRNGQYCSGWVVQTIRLGEPSEEVRHVTFHDARQMYVVATCRDVDFYFPEEDVRHQEQDEISLRPQVPRYTLYLLSAKTRNVIHSLEMPYLDTITSLKVMTLEMSEQTHEEKAMVVVGTAMQRGEDMPVRGAVTVLDILDVVPDPDRPESGSQLHVVAREETKGAVTAVDSFPGGFVGTGQGQKIMIRGLKEDGSCLPVAFLDAQCYTTQLKTLGHTGMFLAGDVWKGIWFGGFTQEPYKLTLLGKSRTHMEIVAAEFLPFDGHLYLLVIDAQMDLHVLEYDPENPKSLSGTRLIHRSTMHLGHFASAMTLLPSTLAPAASQGLSNGHEDGEAPHTGSLSHVLVTTMTGAVGLITPIDEATYRRMGSIQTYLNSSLEHTAGLNPRAYRAVESEGFGSRGIIDGSLVQRIHDLGAARRAEVLGRAGADAWALRSDLEVIGGGGLRYL